MSSVQHFITELVKKTEIDEFLSKELEKAGYGGVDVTKTPLGTHVVVYAMRPGLVIGRGGETIRELAQKLEQLFQLPNPQISVAEIEIPELNAYIVASRIASALRRGVHFRRAGFWALNQVMEAGALGAEVIISGKLRTERARYEKFVAGYLPKSGDPATKYLRKAELHVQLKPGMFGVKVRLMPPDAKFPDKIEILETPLQEVAAPETLASATGKSAKSAQQPVTAEKTETVETTEVTESAEAVKPTGVDKPSEAPKASKAAKPPRESKKAEKVEAEKETEK